MSDTLVVAISQSGTTTDTNRTVDLVRAAGRHGHRDREPPQQRPHRQVRRRPLHVRRARRGDERRLHQGVLRPDRGRFLLALRDRRRGRRRRRPSTERAELLAALRDLPAAMEPHAGAPARRSPRPRSSSRRPRRYWAIVGNGVEPHRGRRAAHQALRALLQVDRLRRHRGQEAHRPLVASRSSWCAPPASTARTPTTSPRRSRSTGPTRPPRS